MTASGMDKVVSNLRGLVGNRNIGRVKKAWISALCGMTKKVNERLMKMFSGGLAMWVVKRVHVRECGSSVQ